jgi:hypothetical protein
MCPNTLLYGQINTICLAVGLNVGILFDKGYLLGSIQQININIIII